MGNHELTVRFRKARRDPELTVVEGFHALKHALRFGAELVEAVAVDPEALEALARELAPDLAGMNEEHRVVEGGSDGASVGGWVAHVSGGNLHVEGEGEASDWWRVAACAAWHHLDETGETVDVSDLEPPT